MSARFLQRALLIAVLAAPRLLRAADPAADPAELSGGETTVFDATVNAFSFSIANLNEERRPAFFVGKSFFNENWIVAPASPVARDGLGPLYNARSCSACHLHDGRSAPPVAGEPMTTMLLRLSVPGTNEHGGPKPEPTYGGQLQGAAIPGVQPEADALVQYDTITGHYADGEAYTLRRPRYAITNLNYGPLAPGTMLSPRVAPIMPGVGLLEVVPEETLRRLADPDDRDGDGIRGRLNWVWDMRAGRHAPGRFGWKAEQPSVYQQVATAFNEDIGITSPLHPRDNQTPAERLAQGLASGGSPEIGAARLDQVVLYSSLIGVAARRDVQSPTVKRGQKIFNDIDCAKCHTPELRTGEHRDFPELSHQTIHPFTDLLLHDLGEELADGRPSFSATGRDWRTAPLWCLGLVPKVNGHATLLHDGRARDFAEAILWHGGESEASKENFRRLSAADRQALLAFLNSL